MVEDLAIVFCFDAVEYIAPFRQTWPAALALVAAPQNALSTLGSVAELADDLCDYADIQSTRSDWYTERGLLLGLYGSVELFLLTDTSDDLHETRAFLERSLTTYTAARNRFVGR